MLCHHDAMSVTYCGIALCILMLKCLACLFVNMTLLACHILCQLDPGHFCTVVVAGVMCMSYTILWLKMVSYVQVNYWCRQKRNKVKKMRESFHICFLCSFTTFCLQLLTMFLLGNKIWFGTRTTLDTVVRMHQ